MNYDEFKKSLSAQNPPEESSPLIESLWYDAQGDWKTAHYIAQGIVSEEAAWIHAYLHRKDGDITNAAYWYNRAKKKIPDGSFEEEWEGIVKSLLKNSDV